MTGINNRVRVSPARFNLGKKANLMAKTECGDCGGDGTLEEDCGECGGSGYTEVDCDTCDGTGEVEAEEDEEE